MFAYRLVCSVRTPVADQDQIASTVSEIVINTYDDSETVEIEINTFGYRRKHLH